MSSLTTCMNYVLSCGDPPHVAHDGFLRRGLFSVGEIRCDKNCEKHTATDCDISIFCCADELVIPHGQKADKLTFSA